MTDYERGYEMGQKLLAARAIGLDPDVRYELAEEAKGRGDFQEFMRGLNTALKDG